jgi:hypothetical protein
MQGIHKRMVRCGSYLCVNRTIFLCMPCLSRCSCKITDPKLAFIYFIYFICFIYLFIYLFAFIYLFIIYLKLLSAFPSIQYGNISWLLTNVLARMRKEILVAYFKALSWHLPGGTKEYHKNLSQQLKFEPKTSQTRSRNAIQPTANILRPLFSLLYRINLGPWTTVARTYRHRGMYLLWMSSHVRLIGRISPPCSVRNFAV